MNAKINNEFQLEDVLDATFVAIAWSCRQTQTIEYVNPAFVTMFGYTLAEVSDSKQWLESFFADSGFLYETFLPWREAEDARQSEGLAATQLELLVRCKDNSPRYVRLRYKLIGNKRLMHFVDITDYWVTSQRLRLRSEMLDMVVKGSSLPEMLEAIVKKVQDEIPNAFCSVLLLDDSKKHLLLGAAPDLPTFYNAAIHGIEIGPKVGSCGAAAFFNKRIIAENVQEHENWQAYAQLTHKAGIAACWSEPVRGPNSEVLGTFAIYHPEPTSPSEKDMELIHFASNLTGLAIENHKTQQALQERAFYDHLTGLANRGHFLDLAEKLVDEARPQQQSLALIMMDVDFFKRVNDQHGHKVGDLVLQALAKTCLQVLRSDDVIGRMGGEEFAMIFANMSQTKVVEIAERLRTELAALTVHSPDKSDVSFTVSLGISFAEGDDLYSVDALLVKADKALYQAKDTGRNRVVLNSFKSS